MKTLRNYSQAKNTNDDLRSFSASSSSSNLDDIKEEVDSNISVIELVQ